MLASQLYAKLLAIPSQMEQIDYLFETVDALALAGDCERVDAILFHAPVGQLSLTVLVALLTITGMVPRDKLPARPELFAKVRARAVSECGEPRATTLLQGME